jgi:quaternary ammonium compound-resistance protein SugE
MALLEYASRSIAIGAAYAVWSGIDALRTVIVGIAWYQEPASLPRLLLILGVVACIAGLNITGAR